MVCLVRDLEDHGKMFTRLWPGGLAASIERLYSGVPTFSLSVAPWKL